MEVREREHAAAVAPKAIAADLNDIPHFWRLPRAPFILPIQTERQKKKMLKLKKATSWVGQVFKQSYHLSWGSKEGRIMDDPPPTKEVEEGTRRSASDDNEQQVVHDEPAAKDCAPPHDVADGRNRDDACDRDEAITDGPDPDASATRHLAASGGRPRRMSKWFTTSENGITSNQFATEAKQSLDHELLIGCDNNYKHADGTIVKGKKIASIADIAAFLAYLRTKQPEERTFYATSDPDKPTTLFLDVEYEYDDPAFKEAWRQAYPGGQPPPPTRPEALWAVLGPGLQQFIATQGHTLDFSRVALSEAHSPKKISFHVNCLDFFVSGDHRPSFYAEGGPLRSHPVLGLLAPKIIDSKAGGGRFRHMRTLWSTKEGENRHLKPIKKMDLPDGTTHYFYWVNDFAKTLRAHTWTCIPPDCTQLQCPVSLAPVKKRPRGGGSSMAPAPNELCGYMIDLFGLQEAFDKTKLAPIPFEREGNCSGGVALFRARQKQDGICPWCPSGTKAHQNNFLFSIYKYAGAEWHMSAYHTNGGTCGPRNVCVDAEALKAGQTSFEDRAEKAKIDARVAVRNAVRARGIFNDPTDVWLLSDEGGKNPTFAVKKNTPEHTLASYAVIQFCAEATNHFVSQTPWIDIITNAGAGSLRVGVTV